MSLDNVPQECDAESPDCHSKTKLSKSVVDDRPDHGETLVLPGSESAPQDVAPQPLDHFKRGYRERANLRERDMGQLNRDFEHDKMASSTTGGEVNVKEEDTPTSVNGSVSGEKEHTNNHSTEHYGDRDRERDGDWDARSSSRANGHSGRDRERPHHDNGTRPPPIDHDRERAPPRRHETGPTPRRGGRDNSGYGFYGNDSRSGPSSQQRSPASCYPRESGPPPPMTNNNRRPRPNESSRSDAAIREREAKRLRDSYRERTDRERDRERDRDRDRENAYATFASIGFDVAELVDRLCSGNRSLTQVNVPNLERELERARATSPASFETGKAITAILSALARRKQMHTALAVWKWMDSVRIPRNVFHYNAMISVCEKMKDFHFAMKLLSQMENERCRKNEVTFSSAISACEKTGQWKRAIELLEQMKREGIPQTAIAYNATISACEKGMNPAKAMEVFETMKRSGVTPTVVTYSALISACEKGQQWKLALEVLHEMKHAGHGANVIAYSAAISALSKGQQWEKALELFREIEQSGGRPSVVTYNATMTALEKGLQWERALDLFDEMKYKNMPVTVVSYGSAISACEKGYQWRQCLDYLDEMTERGIPKNVIIFGAAMSCMEKSCRADIAFQLMERMKMEGVTPNVHIFNSAISACARCNLWKDGLRLFEEMDDAHVKKDVVTYNAVLDAVSSNVPLARKLFQEGVERGFYARVSRLGTQWLELDLHFLSLGGGEIALGWWFEECLVPYLGNSSKLAAVKSIDIVTGYGKTRMRGARQGGDGMRKRILAMLKYMSIQEIDQPNKGRIHINKEALQREVEKNGGRIVFDEEGYEKWKEAETTANQIPTVQQVRRNRNGAPRKDADLGVSELTKRVASSEERGGEKNYYGPAELTLPRSDRGPPPGRRDFERDHPRNGGGGRGHMDEGRRPSPQDSRCRDDRTYGRTRGRDDRPRDEYTGHGLDRPYHDRGPRRDWSPSRSRERDSRAGRPGSVTGGAPPTRYLERDNHYYDRNVPPPEGRLDRDREHDNYGRHEFGYRYDRTDGGYRDEHLTSRGEDHEIRRDYSTHHISPPLDHRSNGAPPESSSVKEEGAEISSPNSLNHPSHRGYGLDATSGMKRNDRRGYEIAK